MLNTGKKDEAAPPPSAITPAAAPKQPPPAPAATSGASGTTVFGRSMKIVGEVTSDEELYLDGDLEGKLNLRNRLTVGPNGKINANIKAQDIVVFGTIREIGRASCRERV